MNKIITISESLWLDTSDASFEHDHLFLIRDSVNGETLVDLAEIPALIEALQEVAKNHHISLSSRTGA